MVKTCPAQNIQKLYDQIRLLHEELPPTEESMKEMLRFIGRYTGALGRMQPDPCKYSKAQSDQLESVRKMALIGNLFLETSSS